MKSLQVKSHISWAVHAYNKHNMPVCLQHTGFLIKLNRMSSLLGVQENLNIVKFYQQNV